MRFTGGGYITRESLEQLLNRFEQSGNPACFIITRALALEIFTFERLTQIPEPPAPLPRVVTIFDRTALIVDDEDDRWIQLLTYAAFNQTLRDLKLQPPPQPNSELKDRLVAHIIQGMLANPDGELHDDVMVAQAYKLADKVIAKRLDQ